MRPRTRPRLPRLAAALAAALATVFLVSPPAASAVETGTWYVLQSRSSGLVLDIDGASAEAGAGLIQWHRNDAANQQFRFVDAGNGYHRIQARHSGHVLDVYDWDAGNGAEVVQWTDLDNTNQQWRVTESDGYATFVNRFSGKALDVWQQSTEPGARVSQYTPTGTANQQWRLVPVEDGSGGADDDPYGYLFAYMTGEGGADGEQVYFALSRGDDPLAYDALNGGAPVLTSDVGERGARDPFIVRSPQDGTYYMIATDLKIHGDGDWDRAQRHGSLSLVVWESADLVNWSRARLEQVSPSSAGNTWAPEAYWDPSQNAFVVYWASKLYATADHSDETYHRMMYATTTDFRTFSEARVWVDKGYSTIDSTIAEHDGVFHRYTKDERSGTSCGKFILAETSASLTSTDWAFQTECIGSGTISHGEGPLIFKSNTEERWYMFIDEYGGRGYVPFTTTDLSSGQWSPASGSSLPGRPRHGTVLPLTYAEYQAVRGAWG